MSVNDITEKKFDLLKLKLFFFLQFWITTEGKSQLDFQGFNAGLSHTHPSKS